MKESDDFNVVTIENLFDNVVAKYAKWYQLIHWFGQEISDVDVKQMVANKLRKVMIFRKGFNGKQRGITPAEEKKFLEILARVPQDKANSDIFHNLGGAVNYFGIEIVEKFTELFPDHDFPQVINHLWQYEINKYVKCPKHAQEIWRILKAVEKFDRIKFLEPMSHALLFKLPINLNADEYREFSQQQSEVRETKETNAIIVRILVKNTPLDALRKLPNDLLLQVWNRMGAICATNKISTSDLLKIMSERLTLLSCKVTHECVSGYIRGDLRGILIPGFEEKLREHLKFSLFDGEHKREFGKNETYKPSGRVKFPTVIIKEDSETHLLPPWSYPLSPFQYRLVMLPNPKDEMRFREITEALKKMHKNLLNNICNLRYTVLEKSIVVYEVENILQRREIYPHLKSRRRKEFIHAQNALLRVLVEAAKEKGFERVYFPTSEHIHAVFEGFFHPEVYNKIAERHGGFKREEANIEADGRKTREWYVISLR